MHAQYLCSHFLSISPGMALQNDCRRTGEVKRLLDCLRKIMRQRHQRSCQSVVDEAKTMGFQGQLRTILDGVMRLCPFLFDNHPLLLCARITVHTGLTIAGMHRVS